MTPDGQTVLVTNPGHIRRIDFATREVHPYLGMWNLGFADGVGTNARFNYAWGIDVTPDGQTAIVADRKGARSAPPASTPT